MNSHLGISGEAGGVVEPVKFGYSTNTFNNYTFPASENLVKYPTNYGIGGYANASYDFGSADFLSFLNSNIANNMAFVAPFDMVLKSNQSIGGFSGSWQNYGLRFAFGFHVPTIIEYYPYMIINTPTVVLDKVYPSTGAMVNMNEDVNSEMVIPKGAICIYTYAFLRPFSVSHKIKTQLTFNKV